MARKRKMRSHCVHFDEACLCCKKWRARLVTRKRVGKAIVLDRSCHLREGCGYEEKGGQP